MAEVASRELRNHTHEVLQRVEAGEELTVTVSGRPIARLLPLPRRRPYLTATELLANRADAKLADELKELFAETTADIVDPWDRWANK